jgi:hypothetical protein
MSIFFHKLLVTCSLPRRPVQYQVWKYKEQRKFMFGKSLTTDPVPTVAEPPAPLAAAIADIAITPFDRPVWLAAAADLVRRLKPRIEDLLGVCAFPPELPDNVYAPIWIQRAQVVAALALAVLFDLACGPMDWTVDAAIIALTALAQNEPEIAGEVFDLFLDLVKNQPSPGYVCYLWTVITCTQQLPGLAREYREWAADYQRQMESSRQ